MTVGIDLAQSFMRGELKAFEQPIENSKPFAQLSWGCDQSVALESAVMELAHGSCHDLTLGLAEALGLEQVALISTVSGIPMHSALLNPERGLLLDANGVHTVDEAQAFWGRLAGEPCVMREVIRAHLSALSTFDEDAASLALEDFELVANFIRTEFTKGMEA
jgi:hypothetical protein